MPAFRPSANASVIMRKPASHVRVHPISRIEVAPARRPWDNRAVENRYRALVDACVRSATKGQGELSTAARSEIVEKLDAPGWLRGYVRKVACCAPTITDEDIERLRQEGISEDAIFEATILAATHSALERLQAGLRAMGVE
jgi:hypothetical protein